MPYELTVDIPFCYGHRLLNYSGKCHRLHGHNGLIQISVKGEALDHRGMVVDFDEIERKIKLWIDENLDHKTLLSCDDPLLPLIRKEAEIQKDEDPCFVLDRDPTAEVIAETVYKAAKAIFPQVIRVRFWETPSACVVFSPNR